ncbi:hypothetical protein HBH56_141590 [Parastagonospora nodorum]|uniref:Uncharacterized protein n=2 Tax=Phaeosphaeria nodorum (strain SN15 / ATCC MYA-4574 / FGSC 10173) TaxID=321614 RepID=Q0V4E9_PHANO|nr:hypothetical protein SNOG_01115 [Parastagonospora nodorum SN15]KAH3911151.1 hypothetical protein HBH56_141590 [Parastagonospora nodorum]EAT92610.1 hypothetical protein SNOG_01115 [Parastagonospora nodorum SN15]KAH3928035.1 hypothetical protein HBH54_146730 [Parastagonospora nodorum]KAH3956530.1 hypothetical protein HBH51_240280 [Parastagonospora nodorum]KAH4061369.1 hypothetical protein HBH49_014600 [Parastagonospora nodorum]
MAAAPTGRRPTPRTWRHDEWAHAHGWPGLDEKYWPSLSDAHPKGTFSMPPERRKDPYRKGTQDLNFRSLHSNVDLSATMSSRRCWTGGDETTFDEWLAAERDRDNKFLAYIDTADGMAALAAVRKKFPGLPQTTMQSAGDVMWFVREASSPNTYLSSLLDTMEYEAAMLPVISPHQLLLLVLLTSPSRSMTRCEVMHGVGKVSRHWGDQPADFELAMERIWHSEILGYNCSQCVTRSGLVSVATTCERVLAVGEENAFATCRWRQQGKDQHFLTPPYHHAKRYPKLGAPEANDDSTDQAGSDHVVLVEDTPGPRRLQDLPAELILAIFKEVTHYDGILILECLNTGHWWSDPCLKAVGTAQTLCDTQSWTRTSQDKVNRYWADTHDIGTRSLFPGWIKRCIGLRALRKQWDFVVAESLLNRSVIIEQAIRTSLDGSLFDWFIPCKGTNPMAQADILIQYSNGFWVYDSPVSCHPGVLNINQIQKFDGSLRSALSDKDDLEEDWFLNSDPSQGLRVHGYLLSAKLHAVESLGMSDKERIWRFLWAVMECPDSAPKIGSKYVLRLF